MIKNFFKGFLKGAAITLIIYLGIIIFICAVVSIFMHNMNWVLEPEVQNALVGGTAIAVLLSLLSGVVIGGMSC